MLQYWIVESKQGKEAIEGTMTTDYKTYFSQKIIGLDVAEKINLEGEEITVSDRDFKVHTVKEIQLLG